LLARLYGCGEKSEAHSGSGSKFKNNGNMDRSRIRSFSFMLARHLLPAFLASPQTQIIKSYQIDIQSIHATPPDWCALIGWRRGAGIIPTRSLGRADCAEDGGLDVVRELFRQDRSDGPIVPKMAV
jgi:hypothetical protein